MKSALALALVAYSYWLVLRAMPGLPDRSPNRFDWSGKVTDWGEPWSLWLLLAVQVVGTVVILAVPTVGRLAPRLINLGRRRLSDFSPEVRERIMPLLEDLCGYMAIFYSLLFTAITRDIIRAAMQPGWHPTVSPLVGYVIATAAVVFYYVRRIERLESPSPERREEIS